MKNSFTIKVFALLAGIVTMASLGFAQEIKLTLNPKDQWDQGPKHLNYELKPTESREDVLTIVNNSAQETYRLKIYAVDSAQSSDGVVAFKTSEKDQKHIGEWVKFNQSEITIKPGETSLQPYQINIPEKTGPGLYQGALVAEVESTQSNGKQIKIVSRIIEPIYISIPGRKTIKYQIEQFNYQEINGQPTFHLKINNDSNVLLKTEITLRIEGTLLNQPYTLSLNHPTILQGDSFEKTFKLPNPPLFGNYKASLNVKFFEYDVAKESLTELDTIDKELDFNLIPYQCLAVLLILIILIMTFERLRRHYFKDKIIEETFIHVVKRGETIVSIGESYQASWKKIAQLNKLNKPYLIRPGQELTLPFPKKKFSKPKPHHRKSKA